MKKKLQLKKLTISKLDSLKTIQGGFVPIGNSGDTCLPITDPPICPIPPSQDSQIDC